MTRHYFCSRPIGTVIDCIPLSVPSRGGSGPPHLTQFLGPTQVHIAEGISIGSAVFAGLTVVTGVQTNRSRYSVCSNRPYLASAVRPNNGRAMLLYSTIMKFTYAVIPTRRHWWTAYLRQTDIGRQTTPVVLCSFLLTYCSVVRARHFLTAPQSVFPTSVSLFTSTDHWTIYQP